MKVLIDARWIFRELSGIPAYTLELIRNLALLDRNNEYLLLFSDRELMNRYSAEAGIPQAENFTSTLVDAGVFSVRGQLTLPSFLKKNRVDVFHSPNYMIPYLAFPRHRPGRTKCVTTIHDMIPMLLPDHAPRSKKTRFYPIYRRVMLETAARSDAIITVSNASRDDTIRLLGIAPDAQSMVRAIYNGVNPTFQPSDKAPEGPSTILYVGRSDPYKNLLTLLRAFAELTGRGIDAVLKIVGSPDPRYPEPRVLAEQLGLIDKVFWTGYLSDTELLLAYQESSVLAHPSLYEGFGLQVLEAMSCGLPVVCSNAGSLPEVAGNAALMVDPLDAGGLSASLALVLTDSRRAAEMRARGIAQASKFSWRKTAEQTLALYEEVGK